MAITSELGFTPAGTPHHSIWNFTSAAAPGNYSSIPEVDEWEAMSSLTALIILYVALTNDPLTYDPIVIEEMPTTPISEAAVTPHLGSGMWTGPGVRYYAC